MKNRDTQFKATIRLLFPLLLACLAAVFILPVTPARADTLPFNGTVSGSITASTPVDECYVINDVINEGKATVLGRFTGTAQFVLNACTLRYVGSYQFTDANGDSISGPLFGRLIPTDTLGVFDNNETAFVASGTGRFVGATAVFHLRGQIDTNTGTFTLPWRGTITLP